MSPQGGPPPSPEPSLDVPASFNPTSFSSFQSARSSLQAELSRTSPPTTTSPTSTKASPTSPTTNSSGSRTSLAGASATTHATDSNASTTPDAAAPYSTTPTTLLTSTGTGASAASTSDSALAPSALQETCSGISCSPALKAAIAVPVTVVGILFILALFVFARRRRRRDPNAPAGTKKKWTRHLKMFSFDAELLVGGRGSNSLLSRSVATSLRTGASSLRSQASILTVENAAPPYRDAISQAQPPNMGQVDGIGALGAFGRLTPSDLRPGSSGTAPPPYRAAVAAADRVRSPTTPTSPRNPFRDGDSAPASPVQGSPFADPHENRDRPSLSRGSSGYTSVRGDDDSTLYGGDDATSLREATVARNVSGRIRQG